ncbi:BON domain-containing protein [Desulfovibrio sp. OttesenSCG-928-I05]|nr:BON domain-containing protein [Desulfovibrio sp. OttesenSCG-928-I05]
MNTNTIYRAIVPSFFAALLLVAAPAMASTGSDADIARAVQSGLYHHNGVQNPLDVTVTAENGVVKLRGNVSGGLDQIRLIEGIAQHTPGVESINNQLVPFDTGA